MKKSLFLGLLLGLPSLLWAQHRLGLHFMPWTYQSTLSNPAIQQNARLQLTLPVPVPTLGVEVFHSGLRLRDLVEDPQAEAWRLVPGQALARMPEVGYLRTRSDALWLGAAFQVAAWQLGVHLSNHTEFLLGYRRDLLGLLVHGNGAYVGQALDLTPQLAFTNYNQYAVSVARSLGEKWRLGGRLKLLGGLAHLSSQPRGNALALYTHPDAYQLEVQADYTLRASSSLAPGVDHLLELTEGKGSFEPTGLGGMANPGIALDLGAQYEPIEHLVISASLIDLGRINWQEAAATYRAQGSFSFEGLDPIALGWLEGDSTAEPGEDFALLLDSLRQSFSLGQEEAPFSTSLPARYYLSGQYRLFRIWSVGMVVSGEWYQRTGTQSVSLWSGLHAGRWLTLGANYTYDQRYRHLLGVHGRLNLGPVQFYSSLGNVLPLFRPVDARAVSWVLGANYTFGRKPRS
jgi:hypothetical protein